MEQFQRHQENGQTVSEHDDALSKAYLLEGPMTKEQDLRKKLEFLGIPFKADFMEDRYAEIQKEYEIVEWHQRHIINKRLRLSHKVLNEINFEVLSHIYRGIKNKYTFHRKIRSHIMLAELKGINRGEPATPEELESTRIELNYLELDIPAEQLTRKDRRIITRLALERRANRINKYGNPYKNGLKSNHTTPIPGPPFVPSPGPNLLAHTMFKPSSDSVIKPTNPWQKFAESPEGSSSAPEPNNTEQVNEDNKLTKEDSQLLPLPLSLSPARKKPTHVVRHNRKVRGKKARKMKRLAQALPTPADSIPEPPANSASLSQLCPHPHKKNYVTAQTAEAFIQKTHPDDPYIEPYRCVCGGIHIGHDNTKRRTAENPAKTEHEKQMATQLPSASVPTPQDVFKFMRRQ